MKRHPTNIEFLCYAPSPYNNQLFHAISSDPQFLLRVHFLYKALQSHPWAEFHLDGFHSRFCWKIFGVDFKLIKLAFVKKDSLFISTSWNCFTTQLVYTIRVIQKLPFIVWTDTPNIDIKRSSLKAFLRASWLRWIFSRAIAILGTGQKAVEILIEMGAPAPKTHNFPYFINIDEYNPHYRLLSNKIVFSSVGRLHYEKGYDIALRALAQSFQGRLESFTYKIAGTGPEKEKLEKLAEDLGIRQSVLFLDWIQPEQISDFYNSSDIFLHPARKEPYGVVVIEAMASGLIVIGSNKTNAVLDRIDSGINGYVHLSDNADDLAHKITKAITLGDKVYSMRRAARLSAENWSLAKALKILKAIIQN